MKVLLILVLLTIFSTASAASANDWSKKTIYQVITDRFALASGDSDTCNSGSCQYGNYCGGTFKGIEEKLDYIKNMGFDAIWISPVVKNTDCGYHGYWGYDLENTNPQFGSSDDLKSLVNAAHDKDMWVMVDIVANHMGYSSSLQYANFSSQDFHSSCEVNYDDQNSIENCWLAGLPDLNTESSYVQKYFQNWIKNLVSNYGFDGVRIDTIPYVPKWFWKSFNEAIPDTYTVGEVLIGGKPTNYISGYVGNIDAVLNYPLFWGIRNVFLYGQSFHTLHNSLDDIHNSFSANSLDILGTFLDNHDNPRFLNQKNNINSLKNALAFLYGTRGIPIVYYGTEQQMSNGGSDNANRDPLWKNGGYNEKSEIYTLLQKLNLARHDGTLSGTETEIWVNDKFYVLNRGEALVVVTNQDNVNVDFGNLPPWANSGTLKDILGDNRTFQANNGRLNFDLNGNPVILVSQSKYNELSKPQARLIKLNEEKVTL